jgi:hypothetical protein
MPKASRWMNTPHVCAFASVLLLGIAGCRSLNPNYAYVSQRYSEVRLVNDSPEVRRLLDAGAAQDAATRRSFDDLTPDQQLELNKDLHSHPERHMADRRKLVEAMGDQPGFIVTGEQYFRVLEQSPAGCASDPVTTSNYVRVRVSTGQAKGKEGWACSRDVQPTGATVL